MRASNYKTFRSVADKERDGGKGGVLDAALPQRFDPLITQRVPLWYYFNSSIFGSDPKNFSKAAFGANIYYFSKLNFLVITVQKVPKNAFLACFLPVAKNITKIEFF